MTTMKKTTGRQVQDFEKIYRANFGNSLSGYKSAVLLGTQSKNGEPNLAIFNSMVHIGSSPPMLGFIQRPITVPRHTYRNIKETGFYTVNHIPMELAEAAHHTSASYGQDVSEFEKAGLSMQQREGFPAPFVQGSPLQLTMEFVNEYVIEENGTILIIGEVKSVYYRVEMLHEDGFLQLDKGNLCAINSLDGYASAKLENRYAYARPDQKPKEIYKHDGKGF